MAGRRVLATMFLSLVLCACTNVNNTEETAKEETSQTVEESVSTQESSEIIATQPETTVEQTTEEETLPENVWETSEVTEADYSAVNEAYAAGEEKRNSTIEKIAEKYDAPALIITTQDGKTIKDKNYYPVVVDLVNCDEEYAFSGINAQVKVRGNSSANSSPYPYRIKFEKKRSMLGLHEGLEYKSWTLLKPYWTFCPNYLALNLAETIFEGDYYASDCEFVHLYMNNKYLGLYLLCEQNQVADGRVEVDEPKYPDTSVNVGYFVEMDNYVGDDHPHFTLNYGNRKLTDMMDKEREMPSDDYSVISDIYCDEQLDFIAKYMENVYEICWYAIEEGVAKSFDENYNIIDAPEMSPQEAVRAVIDVRSFLNMLLLEELVQNYDVGAGSFYFCVDFSEGAVYNKLTLTCPWDFNWAYTENSNKNYYAATWQKILDGYDRSNVWFILLMKADWFKEEFYNFVDYFEESGSISDTLENVRGHIEMYRDELGDDAWKVDQGYNISDYVRNRMKFLVKESSSFKG